MRYHYGTLLFGIFAQLSMACSSAPPPEAEAPEEAAPATEATAAAPASQKPGDDPAKSDINISDDIKKACGLTETEARFAYNSARMKKSDNDVMTKLAECFTSGKLKGRTMRLVGHADPRGESEYNMVLGGRRADNVAAAIKKAGLAAKQVTTTSRGELEARGTDEASWSKDRRVDIVLAEAE